MIRIFNKKNRIVIALGGNAILESEGKGTYEEQLEKVRKTSKFIGNMILQGFFKVVVTHGNGPQVGAIMLQNDAGESEGVPRMPMDVCGAQSQGMIGYMIQQCLGEVFRKADRPDIPVASMVTQTIVSENDPAFKNPSKPVGPFYDEEGARDLMEGKGWKMIEVEDGKWRRVVPSPEPKKIGESEAIKILYESHIVPIVAGGGGVPVLDIGGKYIGKEAVVDKDLAAEIIAEVVDAEILMILTDVDGVAVNYGKPNEKWLKRSTVGEMKKYMDEGQFAEGSMKPKVEAVIRFLENGGDRAIIAHLKKADKAINGESGTEIIKGNH